MTAMPTLSERLQLVISGQDPINLNHRDEIKTIFFILLLTALPFELFLTGVAVGQADITSFYVWFCAALLVAGSPLIITLNLQEYRTGATLELPKLLRRTPASTAKLARSPFCGHLGEWMWRGWKIRYSHVINSESKIPVLLVHGFGGSIGHWRRNISELGKHHSVYALDLLGFGASSKPAAAYNIQLWVEQIYEFWQECIGVPVVLVGNSIGSVACLTAAANHPDMVRGVATISLPDMAVHQESIPKPLRPLANVLTAIVTSSFVLEPLFYLVRKPSIVKHWAGLAYACRDAITDELLEILTAPARDREAAKAFCAILRAMLSPNFSPCVRSIVRSMQHPLLLLWGQQDRMIPLSVARNLLQLNPTSLQLVELKNAGHCAHDECPEQVNYQLLRWIKKEIMNYE